MTLRLNDLVLCGEILNTSNYSTHGWMKLRGQEQTLVLQLTGNCDPDLRGKHVRFEVRDMEDAEREDTEAAGGDDDSADFDASGIAWQQIGPTGTMTAGRKVKTFDCSPEEFYERSKLGEPPPTQWKRCLYLEWFSQNGRVVIELVDPIIEFVDDDSQEADDAAASAADVDRDLAWDDGPPPDDGSSAAPEIDAIQIDDDGNVDVRDESPTGPDEDDFGPEPDEDPYGLFPDGLQQQFDLDASELDRVIEDDESKPRSLREMELMDELIEGGEGDIIASMFEAPMKLPRPEQLDDEQVEAALKSLLGQLALFGIALDVCKHFTPRDAYRLLVEKICTEERAYPELRQTQWVQHFMTSEFCDECDAEMEREFEEYERRRAENPDDDPIGDDEVPF